uniref:Uncharacterized protein n=1 Tax=Anser cygnoides TaxID=8845 RepID=A0A8B9D5J9_ANSCY|nr:uncharacterized protein LOC106035336 [Anser cygnoides]
MRHAMCAAESQDRNSTEKSQVGTMEQPDLTAQKGSVKLLRERWESISAPTPGLALRCLPAPWSLAPEKTSRGRTMEEVPADSGRAEVIKEEPLDSPYQTETFPITVKELQSHFEILGGMKEAESGRSSLPPALTSQPGSHTDISLMESRVKRGRAIFEKMSSGNGQNVNTEVGGCKPVGGLPEENPPNTANKLMDFQKNVYLKEKMALYQAAVSKAESSNCFANTSEEIKSCTVPGGLAAVRKQFENGQMIPSRTTFARSQHQHKSAQETSGTTQLPVSSSTREAECSGTTSKEGPAEAFQSQEVSLGEQVTPETNRASTLTQDTDEAVSYAAKNEEVPKISIDVCDHELERTAQEKAIPKDRETATSAQDGKFVKCRETISLRTEEKCQKGEGYPDQTIQQAQMREALWQPKGSMTSAASRMRAINAIIKNHAHSVRRPHHQGAAFLPVQNVFEGENPKSQRGEICPEEMLPKPKELQMREPLRQPKSKITSAASRIKVINEIHRNQKHSQRHPNPQGAAFLAENVQGLKTRESNLKNKDASVTVCV